MPNCIGTTARRRILWTLAIILLATLTISGLGCQDDGPGEPSLPPGPDISSPDALVAAFRKALDEMNLEDYCVLLHPDYRFYPAPLDRAALGAMAYLTREQDLAVAERIFNGQAGPREFPPLTGIDVLLLERTGDWADQPPDGMRKVATFAVEIHFLMADTYVRVKGRQVLEVSAIDTAGHANPQCWRLSSQTDLTTVEPRGLREAADSILEETWTFLKAQYRDPTWPATPNEAVQGFRLAHELLDYGIYGGVLHSDFQFVPLPDDAGELGLGAGETLARAAEMAITRNMFSGAPGATGAPGLTGVDFVLLDRETEWAASVDSRFPAPAVQAVHRIELHFRHGFGYFRVKGQAMFWAGEMQEGGRSRYYVMGLRDFTSSLPRKAMDETWGMVKGLYR